MYTVEVLATILSHELSGRTFNGVPNLPYIAFPDIKCAFNAELFQDPEADYRALRFPSAIANIPEFLKDFFTADAEKRVIPKLRAVIKENKLRSKLAQRKTQNTGSSGYTNIIDPGDDPYEKRKRKARKRVYTAPLPMSTNEDNEDDDYSIFESSDSDDEDYVPDEDEEEDGEDEDEDEIPVGDEADVARWFQNIKSDFEVLRGKEEDSYGVRNFSAFYCNKSTPGRSPEKRKPDVVLSEVIPKRGRWSSLRAVCEVTRERNFPTRTRKIAAQRAALMFLNCPGRRLVHILIISHRQFMLAVFHRSGVSYSIKYDIVLHEHVLYYIIAGLCFCGLDYLGYDPDIEMHPITSVPISITFNFRKYKILPNPFVKEGIVGRGTVCFIIQDPETLEIFVLKSIWYDRSREFSEIDALHDFEKYGLTGVPVLLHYQDCVWSSRNPPRFDSTDIWVPKGYDGFQNRTYRKILLAGVGIPITNFRTKRELLWALEDIVIILQALCDAGYLHRDLSLKNIYLIKQYPEYPKKQSASSATTSSTLMSPSSSSGAESDVSSSKTTVSPPSSSVSESEPPLEQDLNADNDRYRGFISDFDYACRTLKAMRERAEMPSDDQDKISKIRTGMISSMSIQVLLGLLEEDEANFYHTLQMDFESLFYDTLTIAIRQAGPCGIERDFKKIQKPLVFTGSVDDPITQWTYPTQTMVQLGMNKSSTLFHLKSAILPWIHPYFEDMKGFFLEFRDALFPYPPGDSRDDYDWHVRSKAKTDDILKIIQKYKRIVREPDEDSDLKYQLDKLKLNSDDPFVISRPMTWGFLSKQRGVFQ